MTDEKEFRLQEEPSEETSNVRSERFPELAELEEQIKNRIRSNQRFLERFMDEDFDGDDDDMTESLEEPEDFEEL